MMTALVVGEKEMIDRTGIKCTHFAPTAIAPVGLAVVRVVCQVFETIIWNGIACHWLCQCRTAG